MMKNKKNGKSDWSAVIKNQSPNEINIIMDAEKRI